MPYTRANQKRKVLAKDLHGSFLQVLLPVFDQVFLNQIGSETMMHSNHSSFEHYNMSLKRWH
jgi:hypothetical protein